MSHIIEAIDNALTDWETSPDAMRWTTEPAPQFRPPRLNLAPFIVAMEVQARAFAETMAKVTEVMNTKIGPMVARFDRMAERQAARSHQPIALRIDGHEYHRRSKGRRR